MNQRQLLPPVDQQLLARLTAHPDPAEAARRRRLIEDEPSEFEANRARDAALSNLLGQSRGALETARFDRIIRACCWGTLSDDEVHQPVRSAPLAVVAPAAPQATARSVPTAERPLPPPPAVQPATVPVASVVPPQQTRIGNTVPAGLAQPPAPIVHPPCTAEAIRFLRSELAAGEREGREVQAEAQKRQLSPAMIRAARQQLRVITERRGFGPLCRSWWRLPLVITDVQCSQNQSARLSTNQDGSASRAVVIETHSVHESATAHVVQPAHIGSEP
jgi:hypothetical protein